MVCGWLVSMLPPVLRPSHGAGCKQHGGRAELASSDSNCCRADQYTGKTSDVQCTYDAATTTTFYTAAAAAAAAAV